MTDNAWDRLLDAVDSMTGGLGRLIKSQRPLVDRTDLTEHVVEAEFEARGERFKLQRVTGPAVIERKTHYTKTAGGDVRYENIYDEADHASKVTLFRKAGDDWVEADLDQLSLS